MLTKFRIKGSYILTTVLIFSIIFNVKLFDDLNQKTTPASADVLQNKYPYIATRVLGEFERDLLINFVPLRNNIKEATKEYGDSFSVYFEYLPTGISIGINEKLEYDSASLIKVPLVIAFLNAYKYGRVDLNEVVKITKEDLDPRFGDLYKRGEGAEISLKEALEITLKESDDTAARILARRVADEDYLPVYEKLDIELKLDNRQVLLTTKSYSSILKALYFAAVLSKDDSQYILNLLTQTKFMDKLPQGIPDNIPVAHKIGVYQSSEFDLYQDCGIVYIPKRPYLVCMISKSSEDEARIRMNKISQIIYDYMKSVD